MSQILRLRVRFVLLLLMHLSWRLLAGRMNVLRSVLAGVTGAPAGSSEKVATLRVVFRKLRLALALTLTLTLALGLALAPVIMSGVW